jgi:hypothetical protein
MGSLESDHLFEWLKANSAEDGEVPDRSRELEVHPRSIDWTDQ